MSPACSTDATYPTSGGKAIRRERAHRRSRLGTWSQNALADARDRGRLVIDPIMYAETSTGFSASEDLDDAVPAADFDREPLPYSAGFLAGKAFLTYRRGGQRRSPPPHFYIGAHAAVAGYRLLTRDDDLYRTYFPTLDLVAHNDDPEVLSDSQR
jgi:predicted nucleic acid-binding protein